MLINKYTYIWSFQKGTINFQNMLHLYITDYMNIYCELLLNISSTPRLLWMAEFLFYSYEAKVWTEKLSLDPATCLGGRIPLLLFHSTAYLIPRSGMGYKYQHISKPSSEQNINIVLGKKVVSQLYYIVVYSNKGEKNTLKRAELEYRSVVKYSSFLARMKYLVHSPEPNKFKRKKEKASTLTENHCLLY